MNPIIRVATVLSLTAAACAVLAADYPSRPIRFIVTTAPGGSVDILARLIAHPLSEKLGKQVVVDNRAGGSGVIGVELAARSAPDGYTMMIASTNFLILPLLKSNLPYAPLKDFVPITLAASSPNILVVHPALAAGSVSELIALAKSKPSKLNYAAGSSGASPHLAAELFKTMAHVDMVHISYKGSGPAINDLIAGQVDLMFATAMSCIPHVKSGRLRALAVTSAQPSALLPELPTVAASGLPGYESGVEYGLLLPAGASPDIVRRLNAEIVTILRKPETREKLLIDGSEVVASTPEQYAQQMKVQIARWGKLIREANIRID